MPGRETLELVESEPVVASKSGFSRPVLKRLAVNVASLFSVQIANFLLPLLTVPYVVRIIGPERLGLLNFSLAYVTYFSLLINYGFDLAAVRAVAANRYDKEAVSRVYSEVMAGKVLLWCLSTLIFAGLTAGVPTFRAHWLLHVCTFVTCISTVLSPFWVYQAMEDLGRVAVFNLLVKLLFTGAVFLVIRQPDDYVWQNLVLSVSQVLINAVALGVAAKRFGIRFYWPPVGHLLARFKADATLFFSNVMITIYASSTVFFLGMLGTAYAVGLYSAGTRLEGVALAFVTMALNQALFPVIANAFGQSRAAGLQMVRTVFWPLLIGLSLVSAGLWLIAPWFIPFFFGVKFTEAVDVLRVVALLPLVIGMSNLLGIHTMLNLRMDRPFFVITALGSVLGLGLNLFLIRHYGHLGAAWAWVGTEVYVLLAMGTYLLLKSKEWTSEPIPVLQNK